MKSKDDKLKLHGDADELIKTLFRKKDQSKKQSAKTVAKGNKKKKAL